MVDAQFRMGIRVETMREMRKGNHAEGRGSDSGIRKEISDMEVEQDLMEEQLQATVDADGAERTPEAQAGSEATPQTTDKVGISQFAEVVTGKEFVPPDARVRSRRDQVSGLTATKAVAMRMECNRLQDVSYQVRAEIAEGLQALREKIKTSGGALWEEGIFME